MCSLIFLPTQSASLSYSDVCHNTTAAAGSGPASTTPHLEILQKESIILPHLQLLTRTLCTRAFSFFFPPHRKNFDFSKIENNHSQMSSLNQEKEPLLTSFSGPVDESEGQSVNKVMQSYFKLCFLMPLFVLTTYKHVRNDMVILNITLC